MDNLPEHIRQSCEKLYGKELIDSDQYYQVIADTNRGTKAAVFHARDYDHAHETAIEHFEERYSSVQVREVYKMNPDYYPSADYLGKTLSEYKLNEYRERER